MKIYEMKLAGTMDKKTGLPIAFAIIHRVPGSDMITVTISQPDGSNREHVVEVDNPEDVFSMADCLQYHLDGCKGTNSMIHEYYRILEYFVD
jgi:predicted solute-binding protein